MGTFGDSLCSDESQGSQLLRNAVLPGSIAGSCPRSPLPQGSYRAKEDQSLSNTGPSPLSYHYHGLAHTQSQSQPKDASLVREESQKENAPASTLRNSSGLKPPDALSIPMAASAPEVIKPIDRDVPMENTTTSNLLLAPKSGLACELAAQHTPKVVAAAPCSSRRDNAMNVTSARGRDKQVPPRSNNRRSRHTSLSPVSDDSMAGPLPERVQREKYMRDTKVFQGHLSDSGPTQDSDVDERHSDDEHDLHSAAAKDMRDSLLSNQHAGSSRRSFRDLARTPSQSQPESSQNEQSQEFDYSGSYPQAQAQDFDDDSYPPPHQLQSSPDLNDPSYNPPYDPQAEQSEPESVAGELATQFTQPSTPEPTQPDDDEMPPLPIESYPPQSGATSTTNGPRSILSLVYPGKKWRFGRNGLAYAQACANYPHAQVAEDSQGPNAGPSNWEETQPSDASNLPATGEMVNQNDISLLYEETQPSVASNRPDTGHATCEDESFEATQPTPASNFPASGQTVAPSSMQAIAPTSSRPFSESDMDIVPDSDPSQPTATKHHTESPVIPDPGDIASRVNSGDRVVPEPVRRAPTDASDDDDDDIPLAVTKSSKPKSAPSKLGLREASSSLMPPPRKRTRTDPSPTRISRPPVASLFSEDEIIPSSDPQERLLEASVQASKASRSARGKPKKAATKPPVTPAQSRARLGHDSDDETTVSGNRADAIHDNEDVRTEVADDESERLPGRDSTARKRKRGTSALKGSAKSIKMNMQTPPSRPTRSLKLASSSRSAFASATRVFALWKQDSHYYVGTVHSECEASPQKYVIHFDDGARDTVDLSKLRRCELRKGDFIMIKGEGKALKGEVVDASRCLSDRKVIVRLDDDEQEVDTSELVIASRSISSSWNDRMLTAEAVVTALRPRTPRTSPTSVDIGSWSKGTRKIFSKVGFVVTTAPTPNPGPTAKEKESIEVSIKNNGGIIFEDWCQVFKMEGTHTLYAKRWVITKDEVTLLQEDLDRVFLLADDANHKPKFLIALALGIPCVTFNWVSDSVKEMNEREWQQYLLPAGTSEKLDARITQMVDVNWGNCPENIHDIMGNRVPSRLFNDMSILLVSPDFVPKKASRKTATDPERSREATSMIPRIVLCMGAERVEAVASFENASLKPLDKYNYIVFREAEEARKANRARRITNCVAFTWIKECLITGRLLPLD